MNSLVMMRNLLAFASVALATGPMLSTGDTSGFMVPQLSYSTGGKAVCVSGILPVPASSSANIKFNFSPPANQSIVSQAFIDLVTPGSTFVRSIYGPNATVSGTYVCHPLPVCSARSLFN